MDSLPSTISLEEVARWGYRLLLGREPESEQVLAMWASLGDAAIAEQFLATDELSQLAELGFPARGAWIAGPVPSAAVRAALLLRGREAGGASALVFDDLAAFRAAFLASPEIAGRIGGPELAIRRAEVVLHGQRFSVDGPAGDSYWRGLAEGAPDPAMERLARIAQAWRPGRGAGVVAVDAGANLGLSSMALAASWPDHAAILSFEPEPRMAALLGRNLAANRLERARAIPLALGATEGVARFRRNAANRATNHLMPPGSRSAAPPHEVIEVPVRALDAVLDHDRLDLLKIDVEGAESLVLAGAAGLIARHRPLVVVELNIWCQMTVAARNPLDVLEEWAAAWPHLVVFGDDGRPMAVQGEAGLLWVLHAVLTRRHGLDDLVLCHELDWLDAWT